MKEKMNRINHRCFLALAALLFMLLLPVSKAEAAQRSISLNNTWASGAITTSGDADFYCFTVPSAGFVHIDYQGWSIGDSYIEIWNGDLTEKYAKYNVCTSSDTNPLTKSMDFAFESGTYYAKVYPYSNHTGTYKLRGSFTAAGNNEGEPNDGFGQATTLGANTKVTGFLSQTDRVDFFRITVPKTQKVRITYTPRIGDSYYSIWDSNFLQLYRKNVCTASETNPLTSVYEETLAAGTYYIKIEPYNIHTGRYQLTWTGITPVVKVTSISITGNKTVTAGTAFTLKASAAPSNATNRAVSWSSSNTSVATVSSAGKVTTKKAGTTKITATAKDGSGISKTITVTVKAKPVKVTSISITGNKKVAAGSSFTLKATASPSNASNKAVTWTSNKTSVATVSSTGKVTTKKPGYAKITAKAKDGSGKSKTVTVIVKPKKMGAPTLTNPGTKKLKILWKQQSGVTGYQVQYCTNSRFSNTKTKNCTSKVKGLNISKLAKGTYYVRVRSYVTVNSTKYYGAWSTVKRLKVK